MEFQYLWDEIANVLLVRFPASATKQGLVAVAVSADDGSGYPTTLLTVPFSESKQCEGDAITLLAPLARGGTAAGGNRVFITIEPFCRSDSGVQLAAERLVLLREPAPRHAERSYWILQSEPGFEHLHVADAPVARNETEGTRVVESRRVADTLYPCGPCEPEGDADGLRLDLTAGRTEAGIEHQLGLSAAGDGREYATRLFVLEASRVCRALQTEDEHSLAVSPFASAQLKGRARESLNYKVVAGPVPAGVADATPSTQFLDRIVVETSPPAPVAIYRDGHLEARTRSPVVLADLGGGALDLDEGRLKELLSPGSTAAPEPRAGKDSAAEDFAAIAEHVRGRVLSEIKASLQPFPELRPVDLTALSERPSFYQSLANLDFTWLQPAMHGRFRQAMRSVGGEIAALAGFCRQAMQHRLQETVQRPLTALDRARIDAWLSGNAGETEEYVVHQCLATLGWEDAPLSIARGVRPDLYNLALAEDEGCVITFGERLEKFRKLHEFGLLQAAAADMLVDAPDLPYAAERVVSDWEGARAILHSVQADVGVPARLGLDELAASPASATEHADATLAAALGAALEKRLVERRGASPQIARLARLLSVELAALLAGEYRMMLAAVGQYRLELPRFFADVALGIDRLATPLVHGGDVSGVREWTNPAIGDMPLVRSWKEDLRRQFEPAAEQARRQH